MKTDTISRGFEAGFNVLRAAGAYGMTETRARDRAASILDALWEESGLDAGTLPASDRDWWGSEAENALMASYREGIREFEARDAASYRAALLFEELPANSSRGDFVDALIDALPALRRDYAENAVVGVITRRAEEPILPQFGPHTTDIFGLVVHTELTSEQVRVRELALAMKVEVPAPEISLHDRADASPEMAELRPVEIDNWINCLREMDVERSHEACNALLRFKIGMANDIQDDSRPVDLWQRHEAPMLPAGALPKIIEDFAASQGELMGADSAGLAMSALAVCGAAITDDIAVQVKQHDPSWRESARLWVALVGMLSTKKSPIMSTAMRPLRRVDARMAQENDVARTRYMQFTKAEQAQNPEPKQPRRVVEDATVEALQQVVLDSPHGVISFRDELSG